MKDSNGILKEALTGFICLNDEEIHAIQACVTERRVRKNEIFMEAGSVCNKIYFVAGGLIRSFHLNPNGSEFTRIFVKQGQFCTILLSFNEHLKSPASFQAVEEALLLEVTEPDFKSLIQRLPRLQGIYLRILENYQNFQIQRIEFLTQYSPAQKVEIFHSENADLLPRLNKKIIASYLQITPETYSRCLKTKALSLR